jgi:diaminohydroxyphosphoribosylaminopyrimidine deaminase / 5-amino-6-(5-phosphoribosylamino)uracil reductase
LPSAESVPPVEVDRSSRPRRDEADVVPPQAAGPLLPEEVYRRAITLGQLAAGISGPNPPVGCAIVRDGRIVGEGTTSVVGGPHAETLALAEAGGRAEGATAVVTLEPCAHHGRTGPCADALIAAGVAEVHVLHRDPDPRAAGGVVRLRAAGVRVVEVDAHLPELGAIVAHDLRGFDTRVRSGRPHVMLKLAQTVDGRTAGGASRYLTGIAARTRVHVLRADVDAVLVGSGTVRADDPQLDVRHVGARPSGRSPRPVVLATDADVDPSSMVVDRGAIVIVGDGAPAARCDALAHAGATIVRVPVAADRGSLDLAAALAALLDHRILTVLAEPGPVLAEALLTVGLVDVIELHIAGAAGAARDGAVAALPGLTRLVDAWRSGALLGAEPSEVPMVVEDLGDDAVLRISASDLARLGRPGASLSSEPVAGSAVRVVGAA